MKNCFKKLFFKINSEIQIGDGATLLKNRPALRLDTRLVCKYEVLSIIGKGSFSQVLRVFITKIFIK